MPGDGQRHLTIPMSDHHLKGAGRLAKRKEIQRNYMYKYANEKYMKGLPRRKVSR